MSGAAGFGLSLQAIGIGVEAAGEVRAGKERAEAHYRTGKDYQRELLWDLEDTDYRVRMIRDAGRQVTGAIEAETGKAGLAMTGTPLAHLVDTARRIELSAAVEREAGRRTNIRYQQAIDRERGQGRAEETAGDTRALSTTLSGIGQMMSTSGFMGG